MKKSVFLALTITILAALWMFSGMGKDADLPSQTTNADNTSTESLESSAPLRSVQVQTLYAQDHTQSFRVNGRTQASKAVRLRGEIQGQVEQFHAEKGHVLKENDLIVQLKIDDRDVTLKSAQKRLKQRELEYKAAKNLFTKGFSTEVQVATNRAELEAAKADLKRAELALKNTKIRAPFDGILEERTVEIGDYVTIGDTIANFIDLDPIKVIAFIAEQRIQDIQIGQKGQVQLPGGDHFEGHVSFISHIAEPATRTFKVELSIANPDFTIRDGLTTEITLQGQTAKAHQISPAILTLSETGEVGIKYVDQNQTVQFSPVTVTASQADAIWVQGLPDPIQVVVVGQGFITEGQTVTVQEVTP